MHDIIAHKELPLEIHEALGTNEQLEDEGADESTIVNFKSVAREGDLSPRTVGKHGKKGKKKTHHKEQQPPTIIWNIRSVKTHQTFQRVINMQREHVSFIIALMEPFQKQRLIKNYRMILGMEPAISNINGKIWIFLDVVVQWDMVINTDQQLTIMVYHQDIEKHIMMTIVYAKCSSLERLEL